MAIVKAEKTPARPAPISETSIVLLLFNILSNFARASSRARV